MLYFVDNFVLLTTVVLTRTNPNKKLQVLYIDAKVSSIEEFVCSSVSLFSYNCTASPIIFTIKFIFLFFHLILFFCSGSFYSHIEL